MPLTALAPDMSGVCSVGGTRPMSSTPRKVASVKMTMPMARKDMSEGPGSRGGDGRKDDARRPAPPGDRRAGALRATATSPPSPSPVADAMPAHPDAPTVLPTTAGDLPLHEYHLRAGGREWSVLHTTAPLSVADEDRYLNELRERM